MGETDQRAQRCAWCNRAEDTSEAAGGFLSPLPDGQVSYHGPSITQATHTSLARHNLDGKEVLLCEACLFLATRGKS
ncbi:MAG: hypothetical protein H0T92_20300 [Pyrinomonadaceae bacterium]|nr:hypothetical protein [Pyrinomonadaceae bacterium]